MILFCRYGMDEAAPETGVVVCSYDDDKIPVGDQHPGCIAVPFDGLPETLDRFGPAPEKMGDKPPASFKSHVELDAEGVALDHPWRAIAGRPVKDSRRVADDMRPYAAPILTVDLAKAAASCKVQRAAAVTRDGGFKSDALGSPFTYGSNSDSAGKMQTAAIAALLGQSKPGWTATLQCADASGTAVGHPHMAGQVHQVVGDYQAFVDGVQAKLDERRSRIAAAATPADALAVEWD